MNESRKISIVTLLIVINITVFIFLVITAPLITVIINYKEPIEIRATPIDVFIGSKSSGLQYLLSQVNYLVINEFFIWQIFTSMFVHFGIMHLSLNMIALYFFGNIVENNLGRRNFLIIYILSGLAGNIASLFLLKYTIPSSLIDPNLIPSAGASGAIFGILGAFIALGRITGGFFSALMYGVFIFILSLSIRNVNIFAHLFGLIAGLILGLIIVERIKRKKVIEHLYF